MQLGSSDSLKSIYKVLYHSSKAGAKILLQKFKARDEPEPE